jgi:hypothetical protein
MNLLVSDPPTIKLINTSDFYEVGKQYRLKCFAIGYPKAELVRWSWYSCPTRESCSSTHRNSNWTDIETDSNSSLLLLSNNEQIFRPNISLLYLNEVILQVMANQSGAYRCSAFNTNSTAIHSQTSFIVTGFLFYFILKIRLLLRK